MVGSMLPMRLFRVDGDYRRQRRTSTASPEPCSVDARIAILATRQDGLVSRAQLIALGLPAAAIDYRVRVGRLIVVHRGVYAVGHTALSDRARLRAALMTGVAAPTRSALERRFLAVIRDAGLPRPAVNAVVEGYMVDFAWPAERVIVETDG